MSSATSAVTYTYVYTDSDPSRTFWGADDEEISEGGILRVIVLGYDGLPIQPLALPSPDYISGPEDPQTPLVPQDEDERGPMFVQAHDPDYVPEPIYPEYILLEDEHEFPAEEQPILPVDSPTAESPGGDDGDDDDGDSSADDANNEDGDEEDKEEEEHLALFFPPPFFFCMRTRSSLEYTIPRRRNRRRSRQQQEAIPLILDPIPMADDRPMAEQLQAPTGGYPDVPNTTIKLLLFPFSLDGVAKTWLDKEPPNSILTWDDLVSKSSTSSFHLLRLPSSNELTNFRQNVLKVFLRKWERFKNFLRYFDFLDEMKEMINMMKDPCATPTRLKRCGKIHYLYASSLCHPDIGGWYGNEVKGPSAKTTVQNVPQESNSVVQNKEKVQNSEKEPIVEPSVVKEPLRDKTNLPPFKS
ncbi:hypothetical protein Tco_0151745 [Tanacetum coccineum]